MNTVQVAVLERDCDDVSGVANALNSMNGIEVVACFKHAAEAAFGLARCRFGVVVLCSCVERCDCIRLARGVAVATRAARVVRISPGDGVCESLEEAQSIGISAILCRPFLLVQLEAAIYAAAAGLTIFSPRLLQHSDHEDEDRRKKIVAACRLLDREVRVLDALSRHLQNKEIADELGLSVPLAQKLIRRVYGKLGVVRRAEAIEAWPHKHE